jgi:hypothetical protein
MSNSDSAGVCEKQEHRSDEEVDQGEQHHGLNEGSMQILSQYVVVESTVQKQR